MAQTTKCPFCGEDNELTAKECKNISCHAYLKSELECLRTMDASLGTIKRIAIWWVIVAIVGFVLTLIIFILSAAGVGFPRL